MNENEIEIDPEKSEQFAQFIGNAFSPTAESLFRLNIAYRETSPFLSSLCTLGAIYLAVKGQSN